MSDDEQMYYSLLAKVKAFDRSVDFEALRLAYARTTSYNPYENYDEQREAMFGAFRDKEYKNALKYAQSILEENYVDIEAHFVSRLAYGELGDREKHDFHEFVERGLLASIFNSGDGKSPETAYLVINVGEEYVLLDALGLKRKIQRLTSSEGHSYDEMEVVDPKTGEDSAIYFNVDIPLGWLTKRFN